MSVRSFLDTNILVYTDDEDSPEKRRTALRLFERARRERWGVVSTQVLQEYFAAATRKLGVPAAAARRKVELAAGLDLVVNGLADVLQAIDLHRLHGIAFWDAMILGAALRARCSVILTEDLQAGRELDGLRIVNPFDAE